MKIRSMAPLRLGIAGGGTDVSPYSEEFGGCILNATIDMYAHAFIDTDAPAGTVFFDAQDIQQSDVIDAGAPIDLSTGLRLHRAVYKRVMEQFNGGEYLPLKMITQSDAPPGSGLGSSSTMVVAMLEAYRQWLSLPLGEYDMAQLAFDIERKDCQLAGGKQDQYAATFGGFNFMEFFKDDRVIVNPLRIRRHIVSELEASILLFFTGASRDSAKIIDDQVNSLKSTSKDSLKAMHKVKESTYRIKELLLKSDIDGVAEEFREAWVHKKATSKSISNPVIEKVEYVVTKAGAKSFKVSGAGGGGFMMIFVEPEQKLDVARALERCDGAVRNFRFTNEGAYSWTI